jgi:hypothetical protein
MNPNGANTQRHLSWIKTLLYWCAGIVVVVALGLLLVRGMLASGGEHIQSLHDIAASPWLLVLRLMLYTSLWQFWLKILALFINNVDPQFARVTRRPLAILLAAYELLFASNVLNYLI